MSRISVRPLQDGLTFGARIAGVTRDMLGDEAVRQQIRDIFEDRGVILFEDVEPTARMQVMLSKVIGPLKDLPMKMVERAGEDDPDMVGVIVLRTGPEASIVEIDGKPLATWQPWHFDHAYNDELNRAGLLRAEAISPTDGLTGFVDGIQIYEDFDPGLRAELEDKIGIYTLDVRHSQQRYGLPKNFREIRTLFKDDKVNDIVAAMPRALHPVVWNRATGEKVFHMCAYGARGFVGMEGDDGIALAQAACDEMERMAKPYYHAWKPTDMLLWDNWRVLHMACGCSPDHERIMHRTTIKGDYGLGRWETEPGQVANVDAMTM